MRTATFIPAPRCRSAWCKLSPDTRDSTWDGSSGYHYSDTSILGFSHNHLTGTGCPDLGNIMLIPTVGELKLVPGDKPGNGYQARFSHDGEVSRPGYYSVLLPDYQVKVELTATARAGFHRYTFPATTNGHVVVDLQHGIGNSVIEAQLTMKMITPPAAIARVTAGAATRYIIS